MLVKPVHFVLSSLRFTAMGRSDLKKYMYLYTFMSPTFIILYVIFWIKRFIDIQFLWGNSTLYLFCIQTCSQKSFAFRKKNSWKIWWRNQLATSKLLELNTSSTKTFTWAFDRGTIVFCYKNSWRLLCFPSFQNAFSLKTISWRLVLPKLYFESVAQCSSVTEITICFYVGEGPFS